MTKRETIKKAKELCAEFSKMQDWKPGLSSVEEDCWHTLEDLIKYVEKNRKSP